MKVYTKSILIILSVFSYINSLASTQSNSDPINEIGPADPGGDPSGSAPVAPIDNLAFILLGLAIFLGIYFIYIKRKKRLTI
jgi:LPXTG-motif cell wall-anchored protein